MRAILLTLPFLMAGCSGSIETWLFECPGIEPFKATLTTPFYGDFRDSQGRRIMVPSNCKRTMLELREAKP